MVNAWCVHCDNSPAAYRDGLCRPCRAYLRKYTQLPPDTVLRARVERTVTRYHEDQIRCNPFATNST